MLNKTFLVLALPFLLLCSSLVYHPDREITISPDAEGISYHTVFFYASDGVRLSGWWAPVSGSRGAVLYCHGNAGNISYLTGTIKILTDLSLSVFVFDYRGFGRSGGKPTEKGTYLDARAAWDYCVNNLKLPSERIVVFGRSLGGPIAAWLARERNASLLVLESTFTTIAEVARFHFPAALVRVALWYRYPTIDYVRGIRCPLLVIHSRDDEIIPFEQGVKIFQAAPGPKEFFEIQGSHNRGAFQSLEQYRRGLNAFLSRYLK